VNATAGLHVAAPVVRQEQRHRRLLFLGLAILLLLSLSPVFGHHVIGAVDWLPATLEHLGPLCVVALHHLLAPVHGIFHVLLSVGVGYALWERSRAVWRHGRAMRALSVAAVTDESAIGGAATASGISLGRVRGVTGSPNPAFTAGWWTPNIYVAVDLPNRLDGAELEAVLLHEWAHVRRRDPLRQFAWRTLAAVLFWLPALRSLVEELAIEAEIVADDYAARQRALPLASAILRMAGAAAPRFDAGVGFQRRDLVERRIRRLAGEVTPVGFLISWRSIVSAAAMLMVVWSSGVMVLHPLLPAGHVAAHCEHDGVTAWRHLFCVADQRDNLPCRHDGS
jgi:Zn-dependent protease with chaperone function